MKLPYFFTYIFSYNKFILHEYILRDAINVKLSPEFSFEKFNPGEIDKMERCMETMEFPSEFTREGLFSRLELGQMLYVVKKGNNIIGYIWLTAGKYFVPYIDCDILPEENDVYSFNAYVDSRFRGKNLFGQLKVFAFQELYKKEYQRNIAGYFSWNKNPIKANRRLGSREIGAVRFGYFLFFRYFFNSVQTVVLNPKTNALSLWFRLTSRVKTCLSSPK